MKYVQQFVVGIVHLFKKNLISLAGQGREGITASAGEEELFVGGVVSSCSLASCYSKVSSCSSGILDTEVVGDYLVDSL